MGILSSMFGIHTFPAKPYITKVIITKLPDKVILQTDKFELHVEEYEWKFIENGAIKFSGPSNRSSFHYLESTKTEYYSDTYVGNVGGQPVTLVGGPGGSYTKRNGYYNLSISVADNGASYRVSDEALLKKFDEFRSLTYEINREYLERIEKKIVKEFISKFDFSATDDIKHKAFFNSNKNVTKQGRDYGNPRDVNDYQLWVYSPSTGQLAMQILEDGKLPYKWFGHAKDVRWARPDSRLSAIHPGNAQALLFHFYPSSFICDNGKGLEELLLKYHDGICRKWVNEQLEIVGLKDAKYVYWDNFSLEEQRYQVTHLAAWLKDQGLCAFLTKDVPLWHGSAADIKAILLSGEKENWAVEVDDPAWRAEHLQVRRYSFPKSGTKYVETLNILSELARNERNKEQKELVPNALVKEVEQEAESSTADIFIYREEKQLGPFTFGQVEEMLKEGKCTLEDFAWQEGLDDWQPLGSLPGRAFGERK